MSLYLKNLKIYLLNGFSYFSIFLDTLLWRDELNSNFDVNKHETKVSLEVFENLSTPESFLRKGEIIV